MQKAGHGSFVQTHTDEWYFVHLTARPLKYKETPLLENRGYCPLGRETAIQKIEWKGGWPYIIEGNFPKNTVESPSIPEQMWEKTPIKESFDQEQLPLHFQTLRIPFTEEIGSLTEREGYLRLFGRESFHSLFTKYRSDLLRSDIVNGQLCEPVGIIPHT